MRTLQLILLSAVAVAQQTSPLPPGVRFPVVLQTEVDTRSAQIGTVVHMEVTNNLRGPDGHIVLPKGAKVSARLADVRPFTGTPRESRVVILAEQANWKNGHLDLHAVAVVLLSRGYPSGETETYSTTPRRSLESGLDVGSSMVVDLGIEGLQFVHDQRFGTVMTSARRSMVLRPGLQFMFEQTPKGP